MGSQTDLFSPADSQFWMVQPSIVFINLIVITWWKIYFCYPNPLFLFCVAICGLISSHDDL